MIALNLTTENIENPLSSQTQWEQVRDSLRVEYGEAIFQSWLQPVRFIDAIGDIVRLSAPTRFMRDWIIAHYYDRIRAFWKQVNPGIDTLEIIVQAITPQAHQTHQHQTQEAQPPFAPPLVGDASCLAPLMCSVPTPKSMGASLLSSSHSARLSHPVQPKEQPKEHAKEPIRDQLKELSAVKNEPIKGQDKSKVSRGKEDRTGPLDNRFTFDRFVVGKPNELAYAAAKQVAESHSVNFNPLFLYGDSGLGKTHLMQSIAWHIKESDPQRRVIYLSAEKFMHQFVQAVRSKDTSSFKEQFRSIDVLMIDDMQFMSGKESTQEEFFHTFNTLVDQNHQMIISADRAPANLDGIADRLKSRLGCGLVADIHPTSYDLRFGILRSKANSLNLPIPDDVIEFLAQNITSNIRELEGALNRLVACATLIGRELNIETAQEVLRDLIMTEDRLLSIEEIQRGVAEYYQLRVMDLTSTQRSHNIVLPRQVAMFLSKKLTTHSLINIGQKFGGRNHATVLHALKKIEDLTKKDLQFSQQVEQLKRILGN